MSELQNTWQNLMASHVVVKHVTTVDPTNTILNSPAIIRIEDSDLENDLPINNAQYYKYNA